MMRERRWWVLVRFGLATVLAGSALAAVAGVARADDWLQYGFGPAHNGYNAHETSIGASNVGSLHQVWRTPNLFDEQQSQPIVSANRLFVNTGDDGSANLNVFNATTGAFRWSAPSGAFSTGTPAVVGSLVIVPDSDGGGLLAYNAGGCGTATFCGATVWRSAELTGVSEGQSPVVANGTVYYADGDGRISAWTAAGCGTASCHRLWSGGIGGGTSAGTAAVANGRVYVATDKFRVFDANGCGMAKCAPLWTATLPEPTPWTPTVSRGDVYVAAGTKLVAFAASGCGAATCPALWTGSVGAQIESSPAARRGAIYIGGGNVETSAGSRMTVFAAGGCGHAFCSPVWTGHVTHSVVGSFAIANGLVYAPTFDGYLRVFRTGGCGHAICSPLKSVHVGAGGNLDNPIVVNGTVYAGTADGHLVAFRP
jgi:outer membrane protein assembly factor BamB